MTASNFELRHRKLLHQLLVAAAFLTYLYDREDIVWRFVKNSSAPHELERALFFVAMLTVSAGAAICTWSYARQKRYGASSLEPGSQIDGPPALGEILYAIGLASLFPLSGFLVLVIGETLRVLRLVSLKSDVSPSREHPPLHPTSGLSSSPRKHQASHPWRTAFRKEAVKWGILITMIVFVVTLIDRVAEYLAAASFLIGLLLDPPSFRRTRL